MKIVVFDILNKRHEFDRDDEFVGFLKLQNPTSLQKINSQIGDIGLKISGSGDGVTIETIKTQKYEEAAHIKL